MDEPPAAASNINRYALLKEVPTWSAGMGGLRSRVLGASLLRLIDSLTAVAAFRLCTNNVKFDEGSPSNALCGLAGIADQRWAKRATLVQNADLGFRPNHVCGIQPLLIALKTAFARCD